MPDCSAYGCTRRSDNEDNMSPMPQRLLEPKILQIILPNVPLLEGEGEGKTFSSSRIRSGGLNVPKRLR
ncbi:hypothetical protein E2C01_009241 [Portunus trituberculatus]|uniref:Uncharacterized protein n=1 Tax=Portunus trituberculatus TaxID=210409 RepID=A0A5B7D2Y5_PORTR|nr:hypothetical protein [Portunus trituberculatus]